MHALLVTFRRGGRDQLACFVSPLHLGEHDRLAQSNARQPHAQQQRRRADRGDAEAQSGHVEIARGVFFRHGGREGTESLAMLDLLVDAVFHVGYGAGVGE